ncbi:DUF4199 domain-containing protein [Aurantibacter sp.]|uniref:DUF4199 domain-containing protein n=1 Tax=Aurantibacter sp. TaxID=2807103 RepID=UPI00326461A2
MINYKIEIKWAVRYSFILLIWMFVEKSIGLHDELIDKHAIYTNLFGIIAIIVYFFAIKDKKEHFFKNKMTWKEGFVSGIVLSVVIALLSPINQYIINTYITPDYFKNVIAYVVENNRMTPENAVGYFNLKSYMLQSAFGALAMGVFTAAIVGYFLRSKDTKTN